MFKSSSQTGRIFLVIAAAVLLYGLLALLVGWGDIRTQLAGFPAEVILPLLALSMTNYVLRFCRWEMYRRRLHVKVPVSESLALFMATLAMVITPGKVGEVYKAGYLLERHRVPLSTGLPILVAERIYDFLAVLLLAGIGLAAWRGPLASLKLSLAVGLLVPLVVVALRSGWMRRLVLVQAARSPYLRRHGVALTASLEQLASLTGIRISLAALALGTFAWAAECGSLWLVCRAISAPIRPADAAFIYAAATLAGSLFFLPGGLGGTEGTLILLLSQIGLSTQMAVTASLVVRLATLWLAVAIGLMAFVVARRLFLTGPRLADVQGASLVE
jgi:uncharacterized protein (TIRG00374 family)